MRLTHFRQRMDEEFGPVRAAALRQDHVFSELGGRTINDALESGLATKHVWSVVCAAFGVPPERR
ncbi:MAG: DUF3046 domain-containing protein [Pseudonocardiaceae bacterium]